jgi:hypothetical protein
MGYLQDCVREWREFAEKYGQPQEISKEAAKALPEDRVWTLWSRGSDFLANEFAENGEVISYFVTSNPWSEVRGSVTVTWTVWIDCPTCETNLEEDDDWDQDDCEECEGGGTLSIDIPDCLNAKTEEEIYATRKP